MEEEAKNIRSPEKGQLFTPVAWSDRERDAVEASERTIRRALETGEPELFCRGLEEARRIYSGYNAHTRELAQVLSCLEHVVQERPEAFRTLARETPAMLESLLGDLAAWRTFMGANPYALGDIHKLHEPTMSAVYSVIGQIHPEFTALPEDGELELF